MYVKNPDSKTSSLKTNRYEIYCEKVRDLMQDTKASQDKKYKISDLPIQKDLSGFETIPDLQEVLILI